MSLRPRTVTARRLRRNTTAAEQMLWRSLKLLPEKFRRQHPIGRHVVDFACPALKLAIELDGGQHAITIAADEARSVELARHRYRIIRFWSNDVIENIDGVLEAIKLSLETPPPHPNPLRPNGAERGLHDASGDGAP